MNALKQKWKDFGIWWIDKLGYKNMMLEHFGIKFKVYRDSKRRADLDNMVPKGILDSFTAAGLIVDDDYKHLQYLILVAAVAQNWPRTEITITPCVDEESVVKNEE